MGRKEVFVLNFQELSDLISDTATKTFNDNVDYINDHHSKEMESLLSGDKKPDSQAVLQRIVLSNLRTAIELGTLTTLKVLKELGYDVPALSESPEPKSPKDTD